MASCPDVNELKRLSLASEDVMEQRLNALRHAVPEAFDEQGKLDIGRLRESLGELGEGRKERYSLSWAGKQEAQRALQVLSTGTLEPMPGESLPSSGKAGNGDDWLSSGNAIIEGDNLEVLKLLQKGYHGKVKVIYIDPPYNTAGDFIYPDNFREGMQTYLEYSGQTEKVVADSAERENRAGRVHSNWLNMMYPRLALARNLLREDGVIFLSIDDHEFQNLRLMLDELFGEENYVGTIIWKGATDNNPTRIATEHEYFLCFARNLSALQPKWKNRSDDAKTTLIAEYTRLLFELGNNPKLIETQIRRFIKANSESLSGITHYNQVDEKGIFTGSRMVHNPKPGGYVYDIPHPKTGRACARPVNGYRFPRATMTGLLEAGKVIFGDDESQIVQLKEYLEDYEGKLSSVVLLDGRTGANELDRLMGKQKVFTNPKPVELIADLVRFSSGSDALVLDFFGGSGTTAQATLELNLEDKGARRYLLVQLPEPLAEPIELNGSVTLRSIADITRERARRTAEKFNASTAVKLEFEAREADLGFRAFRLKSSNFKRWEDKSGSDPEKLAEQLRLYSENILPGSSTESILFEILIKSGYELSTPVERIEVDKQEVFKIANGSLLAYLADPVDEAAMRAMIEMGAEKIVCLDQGFRGNDALKANIAEQVKQHNARHPESPLDFRTV